MRTVVITDGKYRSAVAAVQTLGERGYHIVVTQTRKDTSFMPPAFVSRYTSETRWIEGSVFEEGYAEKLHSLLTEYKRPVVLCMGAGTLHTIARQREYFSESADFLIAPIDILDALNDKAIVRRRCKELGLSVPKQYEEPPMRYPVIIKPRCGEQFGLKAKDRYIIAKNEAAYRAAIKSMSKYDPEPLVQQKVRGQGAGASLLIGHEGVLLGAICHRRIREYPITGGPSTCCESFYDEGMIHQAYRLLHSFHFQGLAMVEFKGRYVLEVNPRIWGSFPLTEHAKSPIAELYVRAAAGERMVYAPLDYKVGVKMRFLLNDSLSMLSLFFHGQFSSFFRAIPDCFRAKEALSNRHDPAPMRRYLRNTILRH